jgi:hypothetical protein
MRDFIARSLELLKSNPVPDTFVGRKTHEPFPPNENPHIQQWLASKELQPPK